MFKDIVKTNKGFDTFITTTKKLFTYAVEEMYLDTIVSPMVMAYLYEQCKVYSIGNNRIVSKWIDVFKENNTDLVFYKMPSKDVLFLFDGMFIYTEYGSRNKNESTVIKYIKGTIDIDKLIMEAREYARPVTTDLKETVFYNRFSIYEYHGYNRLNGVQQDSGNYAKDIPKEISDSSDLVIYKTDKIINYKPSDLVFKKRVLDPFDDLYYSNEVMEIVDGLNEWLKRKDWFIERGLPYKRGILLHGIGGTGKSSFARAVGVRYGIPVHQLYLADMTDTDFKDAWNSAVASAPSIVLIEDFDTVFNKRTPVNPKCKLNFDTVLNTMSGVQNNSGIILIITTNNIHLIDEAIGVSKDKISTRPCRIDKVIELGVMDESNRVKLVTKILKDWPDIIEETVNETNGYTPAQVQEICIQKALNILHEE